MEKETRPLAQCYASVGLGGGGGDPVASVRTNTRGTEGERSEYKSLSWTGGGGRERRTAEVSRSELSSFSTFFVLWIAAYARVSFPDPRAEVIWPAVD